MLDSAKESFCNSALQPQHHGIYLLRFDPVSPMHHKSIACLKMMDPGTLIG